MGWCHEFGPSISPDCRHPMHPESDRCACSECGCQCFGRFAGCVRVWTRRGSDPLLVLRPDCTDAPPSSDAEVVPAEPDAPLGDLTAVVAQLRSEVEALRSLTERQDASLPEASDGNGHSLYRSSPTGSDGSYRGGGVVTPALRGAAERRDALLARLRDRTRTVVEIGNHDESDRANGGPAT